MHESLEEIEDERGYRFYLNPTTKVRYKENPSLILIIKNIKTNLGDVKYSCYRSAVKIIQLKKALFTFCIPFRWAFAIIHKHKAGSSQESVSPSQLTNIIHDIFFAAEKAGLYIDFKSFNLQNAVSILSNLFWNVFDQKRQQNISLMELKLLTLLLCELSPMNTYRQLIDDHFDIVKDHNNCITRSRFDEFVNIVGKFLSYLGEPIYFERKTINEIVCEAFVNYPGINGMSQFTFTNLWTSHDSTKFSSYTNLFLLLIRFKKSEHIVHQTQCNGCHKFPIVGMRFKCQKCKGLSLCFGCFSKGFVNQRHSLAHRMLELSTNEKEQNKFLAFLSNFLQLFHRKPNTTISQNHSSISSVFESDQKHHEKNNKLIENEHVELMQVDEDMEGGTYERQGRRRGTIRSEVFNNSENVLTKQRELMEKFFVIVENMKKEVGNYQKTTETNEKLVSIDPDLGKIIENQQSFLMDQIDQLKIIHEAMVGSFASSMNNKTIKSGFVSPTTSLFLPHSSTPYRSTKDNLTDSNQVLCKSINGQELNKSYVADNADYSIGDVSSWFQTKIANGVAKSKDDRKNLADETFETKVANFRNLLLKVKEIIDDSYSDNVELAKTTANLEQVVAKIIDDEEKKKRSVLQ
ncbi:CLUMA_CG000038, isoform A [Clunio marinus]|uniref:CLUMA_CG000038, isoform A n=1 Tax=Clunio marinus TaxID=568069 RepID=A0A1J1HE77_9DIPT|nr:CLUMA_CG000038, isoform A [Clunio marinus]